MTGTLDQGAQHEGGLHIEVMENPNYSFDCLCLSNRVGGSNLIRVTKKLFDLLDSLTGDPEAKEKIEIFLSTDTPEKTEDAPKDEGMSIVEKLDWRWDHHLIVIMRTKEELKNVIGLGFLSDKDASIYIRRTLLSNPSNAVKTILALKDQLSLPLLEESEW